MKHNLLLGLATVAAATGITAGIVRAQSTVDQAVPSTGIVQVADDEVNAIGPTFVGQKHLPFQDLAERFGMSVEDMKKELNAGKPMYQIAAEHGWTYAKMNEQRKTDLKAELDDMVKVGYMTSDEANAVFERMQEQMDEMPMMMKMGFGHHGRLKW